MRDPVCGMTVSPEAATVDGYPQFGFCSEHCRSAFAAEPEKYLDAASDPEPLAMTAAASTRSVAATVTKVDSIHLAVQGMTCASCVNTVESALSGVPGVAEARVNFASEAATVDLVASVPTEVLVAAVSAAGYSAHPLTEDSDGDAEQEARQRLYRSLLRKFWFAAVVSLPVIYFSYPEIFPGIPEKGSTGLNLIWGGMAVVTLAVMIYSGSQFFAGAWTAFKHRSANMNTLIAIGISAAWLYSTVALLFPGFFPEERLRDVFFDVTAVVTAFVVLGSALEIRARARTSEALKKLIGLQAKTARVVRNGAELDIPAEQVVVDDTVIVRPGEKIPSRRRSGRIGRLVHREGLRDRQGVGRARTQAPATQELAGT